MNYFERLAYPTLFLYLVFSLANASVDSAAWNEVSRYWCAGLIFVTGFSVTLIAYLDGEF